MPEQTDVTLRVRVVDTAGTPVPSQTVESGREWICGRCNREIRVGQAYITETGFRVHKDRAECRR